MALSPGGQLDIAARPGAHEGRRAKRISEPESNRRSTGGTGQPGSAGSVMPAGKANGDAGDLQQTITRVQQERDRTAARLQEAEEDLDVAQQRLEDADSARRHLLDNVASGGDEARRRFASALHDDALQLLTAAELQLERLRLDSNGHADSAQLDQLETTLRKVEDSLRRLLIDVSPEPLQLPTDLQEGISERLESMRLRAGIETNIDCRVPSDMPPAIQAIVMKNIAEALTNVEKHARATSVSVVTEMV